MKINKITIFGTGNVGSTAALFMAQKNLGNIVLFDVIKGKPQGIALDMSQCSAFSDNNLIITGTNDYADTANSDLIIITAGVARKPGMTRDDLLSINTNIVKEVTQQATKVSPDAILIVVTNPLDAMCYVAWQASGFPSNRVLGMAGTLDASRFKLFAARELSTKPQDINIDVLGSHGDEMVPIISKASVNNIALNTLLSPEIIQTLVERTRNGGAEIVALLKNSSAYYAPGLCISEMSEAILKNTHRILPCSCLPQGEYGLKDLYIGLPVELSENGAEKIIELALDTNEQTQLSEAAEKIALNINKIKTSIVTL